MRGVLERVEADRCAIDEQVARSNAVPDCPLLHHLNAKVLQHDFDGR
jgi:hypothetical protein